MGTETKRLQGELKALIAGMGWTQKRLARELQVLENEDGFETVDEVRHFEERVKKYLSRASTTPERLKHYLQLLQQHDDFQQLQIVVPCFIPNEGFSQNFMIGMRAISESLDEALED